MTDRCAMLFTPLERAEKNSGRVIHDKRIPIFLCNGSDIPDEVTSITKNADAAGIEIDVTAPLVIPARSSQRAILSVVYGGPAVYHAVLTFSASGSSPTMIIDGTRGDPYGISVEVGPTPDTLVIRGGVAYGWPDAGIGITLPFSLVQGTEYYFEFAWNHTSGDHSVFIDGVLVGTVNIQSGAAGVINRMIPSSYDYQKLNVAAQHAIDNLVLSNSDTRDLKKIANIETSPRN